MEEQYSQSYVLSALWSTVWMVNIGSICYGGTIFTIVRLVLEIFSSEGDRGKASGGRRQVMMVISSNNFFLHNIK